MSDPYQQDLQPQQQEIQLEKKDPLLPPSGFKTDEKRQPDYQLIPPPWDNNEDIPEKQPERQDTPKKIPSEEPETDETPPPPEPPPEPPEECIKEEDIPDMIDLCNQPCIIRLLNDVNYLKNQFQENHGGAYTMEACEEEGGIKISTYNGEGFGSVHSHMEALQEQIDFLKEQLCQMEGGDSIMAIPENWVLRGGKEIPRVIIVWQEKLPDTSQERPSFWSSTIPHATGSIEQFDFGEKSRGIYRASLDLTDNTKLIWQGSTQEKAKATIEQFASRVDASFLPSNWQEKIEVNIRPSIKETTVRARRAIYYSKGITSDPPDDELSFI